MMWLWILIGLNISELKGYSDGNVQKVCDSMLPEHRRSRDENHPPQSSESPFMVSYQLGRSIEDPVTVILKSKDSTEFIGFMLEARNKSSRGEGPPIGKFIPLESEMTQLLTCGDLPDSAVSQRLNWEKTEFRVNWTGQREDLDVMFRATFVQTFSEFWERVNVTLTRPTSTSAPSTTESTTAATTTIVTNPTSNPATTTIVTNPTSNPATTTIVTNPTSNPATTTIVTNSTSNPATTTIVTNPTSNPATTTIVTNPTSNPATTTIVTNPTSNPATTTIVTNPTSNPATTTIVTNSTSNPATTTIVTNPTSNPATTTIVTNPTSNPATTTIVTNPTVPSTTNKTDSKLLGSLLCLDCIIEEVKMETSNIVLVSLANSPIYFKQNKVSMIVCSTLCVANSALYLFLFCTNNPFNVTYVTLVSVLMLINFIEWVLSVLPLGFSHELHDIYSLVLRVCFVVHHIFTSVLIFVGVISMIDESGGSRRESRLLIVMIAFTAWSLLIVAWNFVLTACKRTLQSNNIDKSKGDHRHKKQRIKMVVVRRILTAVSVIFLVGTTTFSVAIIVGLFMIQKNGMI